MFKGKLLTRRFGNGIVIECSIYMYLNVTGKTREVGVMRKMQNCSLETLTGMAKGILYAKASTDYVIPRLIDFEPDIYIKFDQS